MSYPEEKLLKDLLEFEPVVFGSFVEKRILSKDFKSILKDFDVQIPRIHFNSLCAKYGKNIKFGYSTSEHNNTLKRSVAEIDGITLDLWIYDNKITVDGYPSFDIRSIYLDHMGVKKFIENPDSDLSDHYHLLANYNGEKSVKEIIDNFKMKKVTTFLTSRVQEFNKITLGLENKFRPNEMNEEYRNDKYTLREDDYGRLDDLQFYTSNMEMIVTKIKIYQSNGFIVTII